MLIKIFAKEPSLTKLLPWFCRQKIHLSFKCSFSHEICEKIVANLCNVHVL